MCAARTCLSRAPLQVSSTNPPLSDSCGTWTLKLSIAILSPRLSKLSVHACARQAWTDSWNNAPRTSPVANEAARTTWRKGCGVGAALSFGAGA